MNSVDFEIMHIKTKNIEDNKAFYVVDEREAGEIDKMDLPPNLLQDADGFDYYYYLYLKSPFFNRFLNESRTKLNLPKDNSKHGSEFITEEKIKARLKDKINEFLKYELEILDHKKEKFVDEVLGDENNNKATNAKSYRYILTDDETKKEFLGLIKHSDNPAAIISKIKTFHEELQIETVKQINTIVEMVKNDKKNKINIDELTKKMLELTRRVNIENSVNLSSYIMYRKYVLTLFNEGLEVYKNDIKQNEAFFHNLLLLKGTNNNLDSNLWLLDDLFLYFDGASEIAIEDIEFKGEKIIRDLTKEEKETLNEFNRKRMSQRIDLLFFPDEKKCIIIELKDPKASVDENVYQMDKYVQLIANFIKREYSIDNFYTYLVTDSFNKYDKPGNGYRKIYGIEGFVRNSADVKSFDNDLTIANQYSEVIKYSDIYERANKRNKIYFSKLNIKE
jgi:hypothetical protein